MHYLDPLQQKICIWECCSESQGAINRHHSFVNPCGIFSDQTPPREGHIQWLIEVGI
jgi:hypothetical protein